MFRFCFICVGVLFVRGFFHFLPKDVERKDEDSHRKSNSKVVPENKGSSFLLNEKTVD